MQYREQGESRFSLFEDVKDGVKEALVTLAAILGATPIVAIVIAFLTVPTLFLRGWVATLLWSWFVVPPFEVAELSLPVAMGLLVLVGLLTSRRRFMKDVGKSARKQRPLSWEERRRLKEEFLYGMWTVYSVPLIFLLAGYIVHQFV